MFVVSAFVRIVIFLLLVNNHLSYCHETFFVSFQTEYDGYTPPSIDEWIEFRNDSIFSIREFTICNWLRPRYFNLQISASLWSYCTSFSKHSAIECIQTYLQLSRKSAGQNVILLFDLQLNNIISLTKVDIKHFFHRKWIHLCLSFSSINGEVKTYYNGRPVGHAKTAIKDSSVMMKGVSDGVFDAAFIFGQEPDTMRGNFEPGQAFIGDLSELHVWNHILEDDKILKMSQCIGWGVGNIVAWKKLNIKTHNVKMKNVINGSLFYEDQTRFVMFPEKVVFEEAKSICKVHGGKLPVPSSKEENEMILSIIEMHRKNCDGSDVKMAWMGMVKRNYVWYEGDSNKTIGQSYSNWKFDRTDSFRDCSYIRRDGSWDSSWGSDCQWGYSLCTICAIDNTPTFNLKGTCRLSNIDWNYYFVLDKRHQIQYFDGYKNTDLLQSGADKSWKFLDKIETHRTYTTKLITGNLSKNYPIGRHSWIMIDRCTLGHSMSYLALSVCTFGHQFTCDSGHCELCPRSILPKLPDDQCFGYTYLQKLKIGLNSTFLKFSRNHNR